MFLVQNLQLIILHFAPHISWMQYLDLRKLMMIVFRTNSVIIEMSG